LRIRVLAGARARADKKRPAKTCTSSLIYRYGIGLSALYSRFDRTPKIGGEYLKSKKRKKRGPKFSGPRFFT